MKVFKTKEEVDAYLAKMKKANDEALSSGGNDGSDSGWGYTEAYGFWKVFWLHGVPYKSYEEASKTLLKEAEQKDPRDFSIVYVNSSFRFINFSNLTLFRYVVGRFNSFDTDAIKNAVDKAFEEKGVVEAFEACAEHAHLNAVDGPFDPQDAKVGDKFVSHEEFKFAKCWNCQSIVNVSITANLRTAFAQPWSPESICPVCKFKDVKVSEEDWNVMKFDSDPENCQQSIHSSRGKAFASSKTIPWRKKRKYDWDRKTYVDIDESITDRTSVTMTRSLYPKEYDDALNTACDKVRNLKKAKTNAEAKATLREEEPQWIVVSSWTSAHC